MAPRSFLAFAVLYALLFAAFGAEVPFVPSFLAAKHLSPAQIGLVLAAATIAQFAFAPLAGVAADAVGARLVLAAAAACSGLTILLYLAAAGVLALLAVAVLVAISTASLNPLADALSVRASAGSGSYGRIRSAGSAGFIVGTLASGLLVARFGLAGVIVSAAALFVLMIAPLPALPPLTSGGPHVARGGVAVLLADRAFVRVLAVAGLVIGSHAMSDAFAVITWRADGLASGTIGVLLALAVGSELLVFVTVGPGLVSRYGPAACATLGAIGGCARWGVLAESKTTGIIAASQLLHGLTFALVHLSCMRVIALIVPRHRFATAQALYGTISSGLASAAVTLASGLLYGLWRAHAFWLMASLCAVAIPLTRRLGAPCGAEPRRSPKE